MGNIYPWIRYFVFGTFIVCNAIIASMAIWNISVAQIAHLRFRVDEYLASVGAIGLVAVFTIIFVELARQNAVTGRIWFECTWIGIFWTMDLTGGTALAVTVPDFLCSSRTRGLNSLVEDGCTSTRVLMAFTWICTATLFCYFVTLIVTTFIHQKTHPRIWYSNIRDLPSFGSLRLVSPSTPTLPQFKHNTPTIVAPKPRHPAPARLIYSYRSGLSSEYEIEHYNPSNQAVTSSVPAAPPPVTQQRSGYPVASLYPQYLHSTLERQPPAASRTQPSQRYLPYDASPPPLGDWPRANVLSEPPRKTRRPGDQSPPASDLTGVRSPPSQSRRPSGPRRPSGSDGNRPPPLDLSKISTYNNRGG